MKNQSYHKQKEAEYTMQLRGLLEKMPAYCRDYFRAIEQRTSAKTRISYAYDILVFLRFIKSANPAIADKDISGITLEELNRLTNHDIEEYQEYLKYYDTSSSAQKNDTVSIARKMSSLRSFLNYFFKNELLDKNVAMQVDMPRIHEKAIIHLEPDEVVLMLDNIEQYEKSLTGRKRDFFLKTKVRDIAIITLFLGTGIRVSECVGLNLGDINFRENSIRIIRKGGNESVIYFGDEVREALEAYIDGPRAEYERQAPEAERAALFFSIQKKRISVHAVENMVEKYAAEFIPYKKITPHKLRATYGTSLYQETGDIYLVADVLGHSDVGTTRRHYAAIKDQNRRKAANAVKLREKPRTE